MAEEENISVVVITGPTGAGKTQVAIDLAKEFSGEIVNADSMQVYQYLDIGTAKPSSEQLAEVPHHLLSFISPREIFNAGKYALKAEEVVSQLGSRGRVPFLTGGTGLYIKAFLEGLIQSPGRDAEYRSSLETEYRAGVERGDSEVLYRRLLQDDPDAAKSIHPNDLQRTVRALEVLHTTGVGFVKLRELRAPIHNRFRVLYLVVDPGREFLREKIKERCDTMIERGLLREVRDLRKKGFGPELSCMKSIGYRHMQSVIEGKDTMSNVCDAMVRDTRQYARRQRTWFRGVPEAVWVSPMDKKTIFTHVKSFLASAKPPDNF